MPDDLLGTLQSPSAPITQLPPMGQLGAVLGSVGGGPNPVLGPLQAQQDTQFRQQVQILQLRQSVDRQRIEKARLGIALFQDILKDPRASEDARSRALQGWTDTLKGLNVPVSPEFSDAMLRRIVSLDDVEKIGVHLARGMSPEVIKQQFPALTAPVLQSALALSQNPQFLKSHSMKTPNEMRQEAAEAQRRELALLLEQYGIHGDSPRAQLIQQQAISRYGKPFGDLSGPERAKLLTATEGMGVPKTTLVRNALSEMGLNPEQVHDPTVIQQALTRHQARVTKGQLDLAATRNQLTVAGGVYRKALTDSQQDFSRLARVESLERDMIRLIQEGRALGLTTNPKFVNFAQQELASWTASGGQGTLTRQADWVRRFGIIDAQFAIVAQAFERITGNRLAQTLATLARGFHPKMTDPYEVQKGVVLELHRKLKENRTIATQDLARAQNLYDQVLKLTGTGTQGVAPVDEAGEEPAQALTP